MYSSYITAAILRVISSVLFLFLAVTILAGTIFTDSAFSQIQFSSVKQLSLSAKNSAPSGASGSPAIAVNGQKLVFNSDATNIVGDDNNSVRDIFITDINSQITTRASLSTAGTEANAASFNPAISPIAPDKLYALAFESEATNLSAFSDTAENRDIFIRIPDLNFTEIISIAPGPIFANADSRNASMTLLPAPNTILVAFESDASNLVADDNNSKTDIFVAKAKIPASINTENFASGLTITKISSGFSGQADDNAEKPVISADGRFVVFTSAATNLLPAVASASKQIYLYDLNKNILTLISKDSSGNFGNADSFGATLNYNGRYIVYLTKASSIEPQATNSKAAVILYDTTSGVSTTVNTDSAGVKGNGTASNVSISANGRYVSFSDTSSNLVLSDTNGIADVFIKDMLNNQTARASSSNLGVETNAASDLTSVSGSSYTALSAKIVFRSFATNFSADGLASGSDIFSNEALLPARSLAKKLPLEVPADVIQTGQKASFTFENLLTTSAASINSRAKTEKIRFDLRLTKTGKGKQLIKKIAKKNQISVSKLKPGNYSSKYRVIAVKGDKITSASKFSPVQKFTVVK